MDDEPLIGTTLRLMLAGHDVRVVTSGREAQEALSDGTPFDLVLCDLALSDTDAIALSRWTEERRPGLAARFIVMSGGATTDRARSFLSGLPRWRRLDKPFTSAELDALLARA
ncbi:MAG: response regulator [Sandaracinaceae bacterium]